MHLGASRNLGAKMTHFAWRTGSSQVSFARDHMSPCDRPRGRNGGRLRCSHPLKVLLLIHICRGVALSTHLFKSENLIHPYKQTVFTSAAQPLTLTTFRFPFCVPPDPPPGAPPPGPAPGTFSCAFIPALTVSINTPDGSAGE